MSLLRKLDSFLAKVEGTILVVFLSAMVLMAFLQVVLRNGFNSTILWVDILLRHLVLWIGFLGAALAASKERHINIDALRRFLRPKTQHIIGIVTNLFAAAICCWLLEASVRFVRDEISVSGKLYGDIPAWCSEIIIPLGFGLLVFHFIVRVADSFESAFRKAEGA